MWNCHRNNYRQQLLLHKEKSNIDKGRGMWILNYKIKTLSKELKRSFVDYVTQIYKKFSHFIYKKLTFLMMQFLNVIAPTSFWHKTSLYIKKYPLRDVSKAFIINAITKQKNYLKRDPIYKQSLIYFLSSYKITLQITSKMHGKTKSSDAASLIANIFHFRCQLINNCKTHHFRPKSFKAGIVSGNYLSMDRVAKNLLKFTQRLSLFAVCCLTNNS